METILDPFQLRLLNAFKSAFDVPVLNQINISQITTVDTIVETPKTKTHESIVNIDGVEDDDADDYVNDHEEVNEEDDKELYTTFSKCYFAPLPYSHFNFDGDAEFKFILYISKKAPIDNYWTKKDEVKHFVTSFLEAYKFFVDKHSDDEQYSWEPAAGGTLGEGN